MSLSIVVGLVAEIAEADPEGAAEILSMFETVNEVLNENGLPAHEEPKGALTLANRCALNDFGYSFIHYLRRAYANRIEDRSWVAAPLEQDDDPSTDPVLERVTREFESHLLCHSDAEGFYLPIDFEAILFDEDRIPGAMLGSTYRLQEELIFVAPALHIQLDGNRLPDETAEAINTEQEAQQGLWLERGIWLSLFEAARLSMEHRAAIYFT